MKNLSVKIPDVLDTKLSVFSKKRGKSKSAVVREALETYFTEGDGRHGITCRDLAGDLFGSVEGPGDLSYNPKYMEGYGQ